MTMHTAGKVFIYQFPFFVNTLLKRNDGLKNIEKDKQLMISTVFIDVANSIFFLGVLFFLIVQLYYYTMTRSYKNVHVFIGIYLGTIK